MKRTTKQLERLGVSAVDDAFTDMGWAFREQTVSDQGIDAHAEVDGLTAAPTGRLLAVQIKCGPSYFGRQTVTGWRYPGSPRHLSYWLAHLMPVILVLVEADTKTGYWVQITHDAVHYTDRGWWIEVPHQQVLGAQTQDLLRRIALAGTSADPVTQALPLLPPSAVEMLSTLRAADPDGALRLAKYLSEGRTQPRAAVEALLEASRAWPAPTIAARLATIGAYANEHGHRDLAMAAFGQAAEHEPAGGVRLRGIAVMMAIASGDHERADELVRPARELAGTSLLAEVAVRAVDADATDRENVLETLLTEVAAERLDTEPTCLLFLAERAMVRSDFDRALTLFERASRSHLAPVGGRLGQARVLIERVVQGRSAVPHTDQQKALELATAVRDEIRRWAGPSEIAHRIIVQERMLAQAFGEVIVLATLTTAGGQALDREATDPIVATSVAKASIALGDRAGALQFAEAMQGTPAEPLLRAITAGPAQPRDQTVALWRTALETADDPMTARTCLLQLTSLGALTPGDLERSRRAANLDDQDRVLFTARSIAAAGNLDTAVTLLRAQDSPAAAEILAELLAGAGRFDDAVAVCDDAWTRYGALKALQDKVNIVAARGDLDGAEACAAQLLATGELPAEHRHQIHRRMISRRAGNGDWAGVEATCRTALRERPDDELAWMLICAQLNQSRWDTAWDTYRQLVPQVSDLSVVGIWVDLHLRFGATQQSQALAATLSTRFGADPEALAHLAKLGPPTP